MTTTTSAAAGSGNGADLRALERSRRPLEEARHTPGFIYSSPEVFAREKDRLFMKDWLAVARVEEVANPGDYLTHTVMGEPLVVARDPKGQLSAFYNVCRHRGVEVVSGAGNARKFSCPYHAWTYDLTGKLIGAPFMREAVGFNAAECRLKPLKLDVWAGWIFVNFDPECGPLSDHVAFFESEFGMLRQQDCRLARKFVLELDCNWKFVYENLLDMYHVGTLHAQTIGRFQKSPLDKFVPGPAGRLSVHYRAKTMSPDGVSRFGKMPWLADQEDDFARVGFMPPNMNILVRCDYVRPFLHWPLAPDKTRSVAYFLFPEERLAQPGFEENLQVYVDYLVKVLNEDRDMVLSLQHAMKTRGFEPGPMSIYERPIHHLIDSHLARLYGDA